MIFNARSYGLSEFSITPLALMPVSFFKKIGEAPLQRPMYRLIEQKQHLPQVRPQLRGGDFIIPTKTEFCNFVEPELKIPVQRCEFDGKLSIQWKPQFSLHEISAGMNRLSSSHHTH